MAKLEKETFVCLDCETTGLDVVQDRIIEVAVVRFTFDEILEEFETLINPEHPISEQSQAIHNISQEMVQDKPLIQDVLPQILNIIGNHIIVGHGIPFDIQLLANAASRHQIPSNIHLNKHIDTLRMARYYGRSAINSLDKLRSHFNIPPAGAHRAMGDVLVNVEVFKALAKDHQTTEKLFEILSKPILFKTMPLGKHKGRPMREVPLEYLIWASHKDFDQDLLFSIRSEIKRRRAGNLFTQSANPFNAL